MLFVPSFRGKLRADFKSMGFEKYFYVENPSGFHRILSLLVCSELDLFALSFC